MTSNRSTHFIYFALIFAFSTFLSPVSQAASTQYFLSNLRNQIVFAEWNDLRGRLEGKLHVNRTNTDTSLYVSSKIYPFAGIRNANGITMRLNDGTVYTGKIIKNNLVIAIPENDGRINELVLSISSIAAYNRAVSAMNARVEQNRQKASNERAKKELQNQVESANQSLSLLFDEIKQNIEKTESGVLKIEQDIQALGAELEKRKSQFEKLRKINFDFRPQAEQGNLICSDILEYVSLSDRIYHNGDETQLADSFSVKESLNSIYSQLDEEIEPILQNIENAYLKLVATDKANPSGIPKPMFTRKVIDQKISVFKNQTNVLKMRITKDKAIYNEFLSQFEKIEPETKSFLEENHLPCIRDDLSEVNTRGLLEMREREQTLRIEDIEISCPYSYYLGFCYNFSGDLLVKKDGYFTTIGRFRGFISKSQVTFEITKDDIKVLSFSGTVQLSSLGNSSRLGLKGLSGTIIYYDTKGNEFLKEEVVFGRY